MSSVITETGLAGLLLLGYLGCDRSQEKTWMECYRPGCL